MAPIPLPDVCYSIQSVETGDFLELRDIDLKATTMRPLKDDRCLEQQWIFLDFEDGHRTHRIMNAATVGLRHPRYLTTDAKTKRIVAIAENIGNGDEEENDDEQDEVEEEKRDALFCSSWRSLLPLLYTATVLSLAPADSAQHILRRRPTWLQHSSALPPADRQNDEEALNDVALWLVHEVNGEGLHTFTCEGSKANSEIFLVVDEDEKAGWIQAKASNRNDFPRNRKWRVVPVGTNPAAPPLITFATSTLSAGSNTAAWTQNTRTPSKFFASPITVAATQDTPTTLIPGTNPTAYVRTVFATPFGGPTSSTSAQAAHVSSRSSTPLLSVPPPLWNSHQSRDTVPTPPPSRAETEPRRHDKIRPGSLPIIHVETRKHCSIVSETLILKDKPYWWALRYTSGGRFTLSSNGWYIIPESNTAGSRVILSRDPDPCVWALDWEGGDQYTIYLVSDPHLVMTAAEGDSDGYCVAKLENKQVGYDGQKWTFTFKNSETACGDR